MFVEPKEKSKFASMCVLQYKTMCIGVCVCVCLQWSIEKSAFSASFCRSVLRGIKVWLLKA